MVLDRYLFCPACGTRYSHKQDPLSPKHCPHCDFTVYINESITASGLIIEDDQILLVKRAREPFKDLWDIPGGFVEPNEHPEQAVVREIKEELGVQAKIKKLFGIFGPTEYTYQNHTIYNCDLFYELTLLTHDLRFQDDISGFSWFPLHAIPLQEVGFDSVRNGLKKVEETYG